jgi:hypothetical protein
MIKLVPQTTQQEKIDALKKSILAVYLSIPCLTLIGGVMPLFGYTLPVIEWCLLFAGALVFNLIMHFCVSRKWLIGHLYYYLFSAILNSLIAIGFYLSGTIVSPFVWVGLFAAVFESIAYHPLKGLVVAIFFVVFLWVTALAELAGAIPHNVLLPELALWNDPKCIFLLLLNYSMLFPVVTSTAAILSHQLRKEKLNAQALAEEQKKAYRMSVSMMEDLETARGLLEPKIKELEDGRRATLHLLSDVEQARDEVQKRAEELKEKVKELEDFYNLAVGRELKMVELEEEIKGLREQLREGKA